MSDQLDLTYQFVAQYEALTRKVAQLEGCAETAPGESADELNGRLAGVQRDLEQAQEEARRLRQDVAQLRGAAEQLREEKQKLRAEQTNLESDFNILDADNATLRGRVEQSAGDNARLSTELADLRNEVERLRNQRDRQPPAPPPVDKGQLERAESDRKRLSEENTQLQAEINRLRSRTSDEGRESLEYELNEALESLQHANDELIILQRKYSDVSTKYDSLVNKSKSLPKAV